MPWRRGCFPTAGHPPPQAGGRGNNAAAALADTMKTKALAGLLGPKQTATRKAWRRFIGTLADAEASYVSPARNFGLGPDADVEVAEGLRMLTHLVRAGLNVYMEGDVLRPTFTRLVSP